MSQSAWDIADAMGGGLVTGLMWAIVAFIIIFIIKIVRPKKSKITNKKNTSSSSINNIVKNTTSKISKATSDTADHIGGLHSEEDVEEVAIEILKESLSEINSEEEEDIYAKVSREFSENKKEGLWTKALIQNDGDENKAKITYMKLRVNQLKNELAKFKLRNKEVEAKQKEEDLMQKQLKTDTNSIIEQLEKLVNNSKANKIKGRELIPTEYIELIQKLYNPKIHTNVDDHTINQQLKKLIKNSKSNKIKGYEVIPSEYITKIISKLENKK